MLPIDKTHFYLAVQQSSKSDGKAITPKCLSVLTMTLGGTDPQLSA